MINLQSNKKKKIYLKNLQAYKKIKGIHNINKKRLVVFKLFLTQ